MNAISAEVREQAIQDYADGVSAQEVAEVHGVSASSVIKWVRDSGGQVRSVGAQRVFDGPFAYCGGWVVRGGVRYPLRPMPRTVPVDNSESMTSPCQRVSVQ